MAARAPFRFRPYGGLAAVLAAGLGSVWAWQDRAALMALRLPDTDDAARLQQIVWNLLSNAVKFTDRGSVTIGLEVEHRHDDEALLHGWVRDTGMGIPADKQHKIFQPFQRAGHESGPIEGTGIGLVIAGRKRAARAPSITPQASAQGGGLLVHGRF